MALDLRIKIRTNKEGESSVVRDAELAVVFSLPVDEEDSLLQSASISNSETEDDVDDSSAAVAVEEFAVPVTPKPSALGLNGRSMSLLDTSLHHWETIFEYHWPPLNQMADQNSQDDEITPDWYTLQEMISEFLGVKSFKRKHPDLMRRSLGISERRYLLDLRLINESQADMGLTSLVSDEVLDLVQKDYPDKYQVIAEQFHQSRSKLISEAREESIQAARQVAQVSGQKIRERALKSASEYNKMFNNARPAGCVDMQTYQLHVPKKPPVYDEKNVSKNSVYPVAILPGQFAEPYTQRSAGQLNYLPVNKVLYAFPKRTFQQPVRLDDQIVQKQVTSGQMTPSSTEPPVECSVCNQECPAAGTVLCAECNRKGHPACLQLPETMLQAARSYAWQCMDCKRCQECRDPGNEEQMMFCDRCDRGYHVFCVGLADIPKGHWECASCSPDTAEDSLPLAKVRKFASSRLARRPSDS